MRIEFTGQYLAISPFVWENVPPLSVICGPNGVGKTQLLTLLHAGLISGQGLPKNEHALREAVPSVQITDDSDTRLRYNPHEARLLLDRWELPAGPNLSFSAFSGYKQNLLKARPSPGGYTPQELHLLRIANRLGKERTELTETDVLDSILDEPFVNPHELFQQNIAIVFLAYHTRAMRMVSAEGDLTYNEAVAHTGRPPWVTLANIVHKAGLGFRFSNPRDTGTEDFTLKLFDEHDNEIEFDQLSSGEKILIGTVLWMYNAREIQTLPRFLFLDEPDAHLHPAMTKQFLDIVENVLVREYEIRVIMTTHSPSTVALASTDALFEMRRYPTRIDPCLSRAGAVFSLTSGFLTVLDGARHVLVEAHDDRKFYEIAFRLAEALDLDQVTTIPLAFREASIRKSEGGRTMVEGKVQEWQDKLGGSGLELFVQGLVDWDRRDDTPAGVHRLERYSIESYLLDPLIVYAHLVHLKIAPNVPGIAVQYGDENRIRSLPPEQMQQICNVVFGAVEPHLPQLGEDERQREHISFYSEAPGDDGREPGSITCRTFSLSYPRWLLERRGKDLVTSFRQAFDITGLNLGHLIDRFEQLRILPADLARLFGDIQRWHQPT